jgi:hypothetical protein
MAIDDEAVLEIIAPSQIVNSRVAVVLRRAFMPKNFSTNVLMKNS